MIDAEFDQESAANAGVSDGEEVLVKPVTSPPITVTELNCVVMSEMDERVTKMKLQDLEAFVASGLRKRYICVGNSFTITVYGKPLQIHVESALPIGSSNSVYVLAETSTVHVKRGIQVDEIGQDLAHQSQEQMLRPTVSFADVAGMDDCIAALKEAVVLPLERPELFEQFGVKPPRGVLLYGPSGTGKTLLAHAAAGSCKQASVIQISGAEMMSRYVGESEAKLREVFRTAVAHAPAVVIVDEIDALCPSRDDVCNHNKHFSPSLLFNDVCLMMNSLKMK